MSSETRKISVQRLNKFFTVQDARKQVLHNINFEVDAGEFICLLGSSGCGKSTILNLISGLDKEYSGEIRIDGVPRAQSSAHLSYLFQEPRLLPWLTVEKNIHFALQAAGVPAAEWPERTGHYLGMVNLSGSERHYIHQLSGGMQHRVAIARAFSVNPDILLMDEPFGALDELTARDIRANLLELWQRDRKTVLFVTHNTLEATYMADRILMMSANPGKIDTVEQVRLSRPRQYESDELFFMHKEVISQFVAISGKPA
ncbi:ABC transporter ATP-binding protein [Paenibacillus sp. 598K]|uniref:ABC transporter ATP-binding protein n=1 Tax=Paenibacillus sp. 598K TaxID=1117987 RepID=UPI00162703E5|nr:ABC transporter ATP-binding protein [Paenibacillus sp. 598K]